MPPSISVVVTCHDYGHFLEACLASLDAQTRKPDQIIVVDDGSSDNSLGIARARGGSLLLVEQENRGQASAFNAGFRRATGDLILFLDADDTLVPDALEILCSAWHESLAALAYRLNLIDAAGRITGSYPVQPLEGDMRPDLIGRGHFPFMPTSGNAFSRHLVAPGFPLPERRWRISADTVLLRVAALAGPIRQLPFALGNYREHGGNSYHRPGLTRLPFLRRAVSDMADACLAVSDMPSDKALFGSDPDIVRLELLLNFLRRRLELREYGEDAPQALRSVLAALPRLMRLRVGIRPRAMLGILLAVLPLAVRLAPGSRRWVVFHGQRPRWLDRTLSYALGDGLAERRRAVRRPRWLGPVSPGHFVPAGSHGEAAFFNTFDWCDIQSAGRRVLRHAAGEIRIPFNHMPHGVRLTVDFEATGPYARMPLEVILSCDGERIGQTRISGRGQIGVTLEPRMTLPEAPVRLQVASRLRPARLQDYRTAFLGPAATLEITGFTVEAVTPTRTGVALGLGEERRFAEIAKACQLSPEPDCATVSTDRIEAGRLLLSFVLPALPDTTELVLRFGDNQIAGSLVVGDQAGVLCQARIGRGSEVRVTIGSRRQQDDRALLLSLELDPLDPFEPATFCLVSVGLTSTNPLVDFHQEKSSPVFPLLVPGQIHSFEEATEESGFLSDGWTRDEAGVTLFDTLGILRFTVAPSATEDAELHLRMAPAAVLPVEAELAVAVSFGGEAVTTVLLQGEHDLVVPLRTALRQGNRRIELGVHVALSIKVDGVDDVRRGGLVLTSLRLDSPGLAPARPPTPRPHVPDTLSAEIIEAGRRVKALRTNAGPHRPAETEDIAEAHRRIVAGIRSLSRNATLAILLNKETLDSLLVLGSFMADAGLENDTGTDAASPLFATEPAEAARTAALAILTVPPWRAFAGHSPDDVSEVLRAFPVEMARYLCATETQVHAAGALVLYRDHVLKLFSHVQACFAVELRGSRRDRLAEQILLHLQPHALLFGPGPLRDLGQARGAAIETYLLSRGRRITLPRAPVRSTGRLRLGVLVRDLRAAPETWILNGTVGALPADMFDVTLFVLERDAYKPSLPGVAIVDFDGLDADRVVDTIRAAHLDIFLLGAFFEGYGKVAAIVAHRMAPLQVATTAISPMTTGFKSFDVILSSDGCEPPDAAAHYTERLVCGAAPVQRFDFGPFEPAREDSRSLGRARLGATPDAVVLASGAMLNKIGPDLLQAWVEILALAPSAVLVLYPFAASWQVNYARRRFERILQAACARKSVDPSRVILIDSMEHVEVGKLLGLSDTYLDSFPYAGATTVVEALLRGLPVVTLAGDTQRGLQGAAWARAFGLGDMAAATPAAYVAEAARLANSLDARAAATAAIRAPDAQGSEAFGQHLAALLTGLAHPKSEASAASRLLFHHMPKAGGKTCRNVFATWFKLRDDDRAPWSMEPPPPPFNLADIGPEEMICGHFNSPGYWLHDRYAAALADGGWTMITFLRDPLEAAISYYFYERKHRPEADPAFSAGDLDAYLHACPGHLAEHLQSISNDWRTALDRYWFVGTVERLDESLRWLALAFDKPVPEDIVRLNHTPRTECASAEAVDAFVSRHAQEFEIYRAADARCAAMLDTDPRSPSVRFLTGQYRSFTWPNGCVGHRPGQR